MTADEHLDEAPAPRLCHLIKWPDFDGYGFNLHAERSNPGQFIGKIDAESPAQLAGLREGDRIVEVNGVNISNENHRQVVERIKANPNEARLLVVDPEADLWYRERDLVVKSSQMDVVYMRTPVPRPAPDSPRANFHANSTPSDSSTESQQQQRPPPAESSQQEGQKQGGEERPNGSNKTQEHDSLSSNLDCNDQDSIERAHQPPMSPDSGRGDEEAGARAPGLATPAQPDSLDKSLKQRLLEEVRGRQFASASGGPRAKAAAEGEQRATTKIEKDEEVEQVIESDSLQATIDPKVSSAR